MRAELTDLSATTPMHLEISSQDLFNIRKRALYLKVTCNDLKAEEVINGGGP
jgi:hypothetical protein